MAQQFLSIKKAQKLAEKYGTPLYVYDLGYLKQRARELLVLKTSDYLPRYAIKANPHPKIIKLFDDLGLHFDASSDYEVDEALKAGVEPSKISLCSQQPPRDINQILNSGVRFVATSMYQLDLVVATGWKGEIAVRLNPGLGSGHSRRTTTGGASSSFGIWHEYLPQVLDWQVKSGANINRLHIHIGSGAEASIWRAAIKSALELVGQMPSVGILNMGGGFKIARMPGESPTDMAQIMEIFDAELADFKTRTGRSLQLEVEPGTWLVGNSAVLLSRIVDIVDTGKKGFNFIKLDTGMNDLLRPAMYGAQHPIGIVNNAKTKKDYVVVGHNCETGDILSPASGNPEAIQPRKLNEAHIGDLVTVGGVGAYGASMRAVGYNSYPSATEFFING